MTRILVITSCTGDKIVKTDRALTLEDFQRGGEHLAQRERELEEFLTPAERLYSGQQHVRLMRGVQTFRDGLGEKCRNVALDLWILSAGYGLVPGDRKLAPYECTFQGMKPRTLRNWADKLGVPAEFRRLVSGPYDLALINLGDAYLEACKLGSDVRLGGPTVLFCGTTKAKKLPRLERLRVVTLSNPQAKRFSCGLVGLKGELSGRLLERLARDPESPPQQLIDPATELLELLDGSAGPAKGTRSKPRINPNVDRVIEIPDSWWRNPRRDHLRYFIPEWDDLVDPDYDFQSDMHSGGSGDWSNQVYAHQLYPEPSYDGILVSKAVAEKSTKKRVRINDLGVHRYLRVPREFPILGDCGAFDYINEESPRYSTGEMLEYYTRLGFDLGVSVDHLIVTATEAQKAYRYELTIHNAEEFLREHRKLSLQWEPIGAIQGWDAQSYVEAAKSYVAMGYRYIAIGGLVRSGTRQILETLERVHEVVPPTVKVHLFGLARFRAIGDFVRFGVSSIDSASVLRKAWLGANLNFLTTDGWYSAIRVPQSDSCFRAKRLIEAGQASISKLHELERACLEGLRDHGRKRTTPSPSLLDHLTEYDALVAGARNGTRERIRRTLEDRPWETCGCEICDRCGIEVAIFRGNNRNRRRGFHNTRVFYQLLDRLLDGERIAWLDKENAQGDVARQLQLFAAE